MEMQTRKVKRLTFEGSENAEPSWSPTEDLIVYSSLRNGVYQLFTLNPYKNDPPTQVTKDLASHESPAWSPDGNQIIFTKRDGKKNQIYGIMKNGSFQRRLIHSSRQPELSPMVKVRHLDNNLNDYIIMKKTVVNFLLLASFSPFLVQCASQTEIEDLRYQLRIVNKKVEDIKGNTVDQLQKRQASASGQMDQVEQDILLLKSQLEETYHLNQRLKEQNKELEATISNVVQTEASKREEALRNIEETQRENEQKLTAELNEKLRQQQESVKAIQEARIKEAERRAKDAALAAQLAKTRSSSASSAVPVIWFSRVISGRTRKKSN